MRPCDCKSKSDISKLEAEGISCNERKITIDSSNVRIEIVPQISVKISHSTFKQFATWYLEEQGRL